MVGILGMPYADNVSADGSVAVGGRYRYTLGEGLVPLPRLPGDTFNSAHGISSDGSVMVGTSGERFCDPWFGCSTTQDAVRWNADGSILNLGAEVANGVSADGSTVVGRGSSTAFRWTAGSGTVSLGDLPGGTSSSIAFGVSGDGSVVVGWGNGTGGTEAFRWTAGGGMVGLGVLPGDQYSSAEGITADGSAVWGSSESASHQKHAFIWDETNGMRNVQDMLTNDYGLDLTGWSLSITEGISDDGRVIIGYGRNPSGNTEAWMAVLAPLLTCVATGNWNDATTWDDGTVTPSEDYQTLVDNHTVTVAADGAAASLSIKDAGSVVIGAGNTLRVVHDVEVTAGTILDVAGTLDADSLNAAGIINVADGAGISLAGRLTLDSILDMTGATLTTRAGVTRIIVNSGGVLTVDDALTGAELNVAGSVQTQGVEVSLLNVHDGGILTTGGITADSIQLAGGIVNAAGATAATLEVSEGSLTASGPVTADVVTVSGGEVHLIDGAVLNVGATEVAGGTLTTGGVNAATLEVSEGSLTASGPVTADVVNVSGGAVHLIGGANFNVGAMEVAGEGAVVNTGAGQVIVSDTLQLPMRNMTVTTDATFAVAGSDLANPGPGKERTFTLLGGTTTIATPVGDPMAYWSFDRMFQAVFFAIVFTADS